MSHKVINIFAFKDTEWKYTFPEHGIVDDPISSKLLTKLVKLCKYVDDNSDNIAISLSNRPFPDSPLYLNLETNSNVYRIRDVSDILPTGITDSFDSMPKIMHIKIGNVHHIKQSQLTIIRKYYKESQSETYYKEIGLSQDVINIWNTLSIDARCAIIEYHQINLNNGNE